MVEVNPHYISQLSTGATIGHIEDDVDFPHTGLFKSLMQGVSGNFVIKNNTNDFDITQSASDPVVSVAVGSYLDNGELKTTSGVATFNSAAFTFTTNKAYYLLVVDSSGTVALRVPTVANRVANHSAGDTIIAMIEIADDTAFGSRKVQFFTSSKTDNHLSIARDNSGAYTEMGKITSDADSIDISTTNSNADINLTPHGTGDVKLGTLAIDGDQTVGSGQDGYVLTYTHSNTKAALAALPTSLSNVVEDTTPQLGGNLDTNSNHIDFDDAHGIRDSNGNEQLIFQETSSAVNYVEITNSATGNRPQIAAVGDDTDIGITIKTKGGGDVLLDTDYLFVNRVQLGYGTGPGKLQVYNAGDNLELYAAGDSNGNQKILELDAGTDGAEANRIASVSGHLEVSQEIRSKGYIRNITEVVGSALGPPPVVNYSVLETDDIIIAKAPSGSPPNDLTLNLPDAEAADIGRTYRIIASDATATLSLDKTGTDDTIEDTTGGTLTLPYSLSAGKIYDITCIDADRWMLMQLN
jgi:hypothetical protein